MFSNLTAMWLSGQGGQYLQSVGLGFKPPPSYSLEFFFFFFFLPSIPLCGCNLFIANLSYFPISYNVLHLFILRITLIWLTDMVNNYGVKMDNTK